jgi:hypothetical protein
MLVFLIPVTFFSYIPGLIQKAVASAAGGCTGVSRGSGPLSLKWPFALVNLVCLPSSLCPWFIHSIIEQLFDTLVCVLSTIKLVKNVKTGGRYVPRE